MYIGEETRPNTFNAIYFVAAIIVHIVLFLSIWFIGMRNEDEDKELVIPMELMVVVNENLDGVENEPPPETPPVEEPPPPEPEPEPEPQPEPPPPDPVEVPEAVVLEPEKPKPPKPPEPKPPKPPDPKPEPPKEPEKPKTPKKTREQRLAEMRNSTTKIKNPTRTTPPKNNGRTEMRPRDWEKLLMQGYKPGATNKGLDASEEARCKALIREAFYSKWDRPAWTSSLKIMYLTVNFGPGGEVRGYNLTKSSEDAAADRSVLAAASRVSRVRGLSRSFLDKIKNTVTVRFEVTPE